MSDFSILWRRLDVPGHESARLLRAGGNWHLAGTAVFADAGGPCRLDYLVICDTEWRTQSGCVTGWIGPRIIDVVIDVTADQRWRMNGIECAEVAGAIDLDLNFSPSTNLLPIRRLSLAVGARAAVRAAWLRFPSFALEPLEQVYQRVADGQYRYESGGGRFVADLLANETGFVVEYPGFWRVEKAN